MLSGGQTTANQRPELAAVAKRHGGWNVVNVFSDNGSGAKDRLDTSTPSGRAMFQMMDVFAEFERAIIREPVLSDTARAKAEGLTLDRQVLEDSAMPSSLPQL
jgi:DNA invertase Pin-like site-specific DNA recombinase